MTYVVFLSLLLIKQLLVLLRKQVSCYLRNHLRSQLQILLILHLLFNRFFKEANDYPLHATNVISLTSKTSTSPLVCIFKTSTHLILFAQLSLLFLVVFFSSQAIYLFGVDLIVHEIFYLLKCNLRHCVLSSVS